MNSVATSYHCWDLYSNLSSSSGNCSYLSFNLSSLMDLCINMYSLENNMSYLENKVDECDSSSYMEGQYSAPMELIGVYISIASLFCILAMALDLFNGFRNRKFWFPNKYFSLNAASITVITVAMKLPVDLTSEMPDRIDQAAKNGSLAFMCTMMANLMPSLASMDNKSLLANVIGLSILVITIIANVFIQIRTQVIHPTEAFNYILYRVRSSLMAPAYIYMGMLLILLLILISSAITIPSSKKILEFKYQATSKTTLNDQHPQENLISTVHKLRQLVERYWIMAETGSSQFVMASTPLSSASGIICAVSMLLYLILLMFLYADFWCISCFLQSDSVYKRSMSLIFITQTFGILVGSIAPIFRCFTLLSFKSFANQNKKHFMVFKVEKYWTQKLNEWKEIRVISFSSNGPRSRALLHNLKNRILSLWIGFQTVTIVSCKIIGLPPIIVIIFVIYCWNYFKSLKEKLFPISTDSSSVNTNEDLSKYVLLLEDNTQLAKKTVKRISDSMKRLIKKAEKKQHNNLLKLLEGSVAFNGVEMFDIDQIQSLLPFELVNTWSLPIISLTCIAVGIPNIQKDKVDSMLKSVGEGLLYTHLVEESLNGESEYVNIRRATVALWHEVEENYKWVDTTLERRACEGKTPREIVKSFAHIAEQIVNEYNNSTSGEPLEKENLPLKVIAANSMYRIAKTIMHTYESKDLKIIGGELFTRLSGMIADILAACLTNIPRAIAVRCHESAIEKREASVAAAIHLLGQTTEIIKRLETRELPIMDQDKLAYIDEWRLHLSHP